MITVLKLGGELLENAAAMQTAAVGIVQLAATEPLVVVHGGGRAIDAELARRGVTPRFADGLRVTDEATLDAVVAVLAGTTNTALVAAIGAAGGRAVGLTGADGSIGRSVLAGLHHTTAGEDVDLGRVGQPDATDMRLLVGLLELGYVPVVASIGVNRSGELLNVNADSFAAHLAGALGARQLIVAGTTAGVLDADGRTIERLTLDDITTMTAAGTAHSGMVAKLAACRFALLRGVLEVSIVSGRDGVPFVEAPGTRIVTAPADLAAQIAPSL